MFNIKIKKVKTIKPKDSLTEYCIKTYKLYCYLSLSLFFFFNLKLCRRQSHLKKKINTHKIRHNQHRLAERKNKLRITTK